MLIQGSWYRNVCGNGLVRDFAAFFLLSRDHGLTIYNTVSGGGSDEERAATGSLDNLAVRVSTTG